MTLKFSHFDSLFSLASGSLLRFGGFLVVNCMRLDFVSTDLTKANEYFSPGKKKGQDDVLHTEQGSLAFSDLLLEVRCLGSPWDVSFV